MTRFYDLSRASAYSRAPKSLGDRIEIEAVLAKDGHQIFTAQHLVEDHGDVLHKDRVWKVGLGGELLDPGAQVGDRGLVGGVLGAGDLEVDGRAFEVGQFAVGDGGTDGTGDGVEHAGTVAGASSPSQSVGWRSTRGISRSVFSW